MSLFDRIFPKGSKTAAVLQDIEDKRDAAIRNFENAKLRETWYERIDDANNVIRVVEIQDTIIKRIRYRTLENIRYLETMNNFHESGDIDLVHDLRKPYHTSQNCVEIVFRTTYRPVTDQSKLTQLENRYQQVLNDYGIRMEAYKATLRQPNTSVSQQILEEFLNPNRQSDSIPTSGEHNSNFIFPDPLDPPMLINAYGGHVEIPTSVLPDEYKKELLNLEDKKQISSDPKKRLESIE